MLVRWEGDQEWLADGITAYLRSATVTERGRQGLPARRSYPGRERVPASGGSAEGARDPWLRRSAGGRAQRACRCAVHLSRTGASLWSTELSQHRHRPRDKPLKAGQLGHPGRVEHTVQYQQRLKWKCIGGGTVLSHLSPCCKPLVEG